MAVTSLSQSQVYSNPNRGERFYITTSHEEVGSLTIELSFNRDEPGDRKYYRVNVSVDSTNGNEYQIELTVGDNLLFYLDESHDLWSKRTTLGGTVAWFANISNPTSNKKALQPRDDNILLKITLNSRGWTYAAKSGSTVDVEKTE